MSYIAHRNMDRWGYPFYIRLNGLTSQFISIRGNYCKDIWITYPLIEAKPGMDERKKLYTDYTNKINNLEEYINDEMSKYDLKEFDFEYGFEREIEPEFYPIPLKEFLADAKKELRELIRQRNFVYGYSDEVEEDYYDHE